MIDRNKLRVGDHVMTQGRHYSRPGDGWTQDGARSLIFVSYTVKVATFHDEEHLWGIDLDNDGHRREPKCCDVKDIEFISRDVSNRLWRKPKRGRAWPFVPNFRSSEV